MIDLRKGDCLEIMKDIPDKSIDAIICDLPYGVYPILHLHYPCLRHHKANRK